SKPVNNHDELDQLSESDESSLALNQVETSEISKPVNNHGELDHLFESDESTLDSSELQESNINNPPLKPLIDWRLRRKIQKTLNKGKKPLAILGIGGLAYLFHHLYIKPSPTEPWPGENKPEVSETIWPEANLPSDLAKEDSTTSSTSILIGVAIFMV